MRFKENDMVVCVSTPNSSLKVGSIYKVLEGFNDRTGRFIKILNDNGIAGFYHSERFELVDKKEMKFNLTIEGDNIADFLYKLENAYNIVSEAVKTEKAYEEAYLKLEALLDDKTGSSGLF